MGCGSRQQRKWRHDMAGALAYARTQTQLALAHEHQGQQAFEAQREQQQHRRVADRSGHQKYGDRRLSQI